MSAGSGDMPRGSKAPLLVQTRCAIGTRPLRSGKGTGPWAHGVILVNRWGKRWLRRIDSG